MNTPFNSYDYSSLMVMFMGIQYQTIAGLYLQIALRQKKPDSLSISDLYAKPKLLLGIA